MKIRAACEPGTGTAPEARHGEAVRPDRHAHRVSGDRHGLAGVLDHGIDEHMEADGLAFVVAAEQSDHFSLALMNSTPAPPERRPLPPRHRLQEPQPLLPARRRVAAVQRQRDAVVALHRHAGDARRPRRSSGGRRPAKRPAGLPRWGNCGAQPRQLVAVPLRPIDDLAVMEAPTARSTSPAPILRPGAHQRPLFLPSPTGTTGPSGL